MARDAGKIWQQPPPFNGQNYDTLTKKMKTIMVANYLWEFVINGFNDVIDPTSMLPLPTIKRLSSAKGVMEKECKRH